jgi:energy-coupling factor transporter ATP-binding protein EcfA2
MVDTGDPSASVETLIFDRLTEAALPVPVADLVVAALLGDDDLDAVLGEKGWHRPPTPEATAGETVPRFFLRSITAERFRGIGAKATLDLQPGPGLTLIVGRNGSGKSSFAEAAELAITGASKRWAHNTAARGGWRNIHSAGAAQVAVTLAADGQAGTTTLAREWAPGAELDDATVYVQEPGARRVPGNPDGWAAPLELYRPFLSYSELGALLDGRPSDMYDALQAILGLDQLIDAERRLAAARKHLDDTSKRARQALPDLRSRLAEHSDERARQAEAALSGRRWDLDSVDALAVGEQTPDGGVPGRLYQISSIELPGPQVLGDAVERLAKAEQELAGQAGTPAGEAQRTANLLRMALAHFTDHPGQACPVCGGRPLDEAWAAQAREEVSRLAVRARDADAARTEHDEALQALRNLLPSEPPVLLAQDLGSRMSAASAREAWQRWTRLVSDLAPSRLAEDAPAALARLADAVAQLQTAARLELTRRSEAWQPVAAALAAWTTLARASQHAADDLARVRQALDWLKASGQEIRNARLAPFARLSAEIWDTLRQESNVELGPIRLEGSATRRHVSLDATVDGVACAALGVMSQGELHALGLALFLPRATSADSPFRFLVIDDPVQSMDPAKVDGLARVLAGIAKTRQVIVFTHDDRLAEAVRRLQIPATVWEVVRRENSAVELKKNDDPVKCYLGDARALALTRDLPQETRAVVVAAFCRSALEAACQEKIRKHRIGLGARHAEIDQAISQAHTLREMTALALFDEVNRGSQVAGTLRSRYGAAAADAFQAAITGPHAPYPGDLTELVKDIGRLAEQLRQ